jgi:hypothetical protein
MQQSCRRRLQLPLRTLWPLPPIRHQIGSRRERKVVESVHRSFSSSSSSIFGRPHPLLRHQLDPQLGMRNTVHHASHKQHFTRHTSRITRHMSHVTRHTSFFRWSAQLLASRSSAR